MEFKDLEDLKTAFATSRYTVTDEFNVGGIRYAQHISPRYAMDEVLRENDKPFIIFARHLRDKDASKAIGLDEWILLLWAGVGGNRVIPFDVRTTSRARIEGRSITEGGMDQYQKPDNIIGSTVAVKFTSLPGSGELKGKVDTGATICSLHADNYKINREANTITFKSPELSQNELTVPLIDQQAVKSADGGSEYRPVIELNIKINDKMMNSVKFNLNDRAHMEFPVLIGKNALGDGKFLIDPRMDESQLIDGIDFSAFREELRKEVVVETEDNAANLYALLKESDISFADIINHIKTDLDK